jgi:oxalate decarboxylase/phosphoglucose isomerase-like protein (cupin superfamily)
VEKLVFDWGSIKWLSEPRVTGTARFTMGVVLLEPGKGHVRHNHPGCEEILYVVSGQGSQMIDTGVEMWEPVQAGDMVHIPPDIFHSTVNIGWEPLKLIAVYSPPGPEALLRSLPECRVIPAGALPGL